MAPTSLLRLVGAGPAQPQSNERLLPLARRFARRVLAPLLVTIMVAAAVAAFLPFIGYRALTVRSGSMAPALLTGDLIVTHLVRPSSVRIGDIVTFSDQSRDGVLVTHRVIEVSRQGQTYSFVTKGDSNTGVDKWTIGKEGEVDRLTLRVPNLGFTVARVSSPVTRTVLVGFSLALLAIPIVRKIWS